MYYLNLEKYCIPMKAFFNLAVFVFTIMGFCSCDEYHRAGEGSGNTKYASDYRFYTKNACATADSNHICYFIINPTDLRATYGTEINSDLRVFAIKSADGRLGCAVGKQASRTEMDMSSPMLVSAAGTTCPYDCWVGTRTVTPLAPAERIPVNAVRPLAQAYSATATGSMTQLKIPKELLGAGAGMPPYELLQFYPVKIADEEKILAIPLKADGTAAGTIYYVLDAANRCPYDCLLQ
jgi:hypothetical protein